MPGRISPRSVVRFEVTPRFEIFYALRALGEKGEATAAWRNETARLLPSTFGSSVERVAPRPIMWALLADTLRDARSDPDFTGILDALESLDDSSFQRAILDGVFRGSGTVESLVAGEQSLADAVRSESEAGSALLALMGLDPFDRSSAEAGAFNRIITEPGDYRADLSHALEVFWESAFKDNWKLLHPRMKRVVKQMQRTLESRSFSAFAREIKLPVAFDDRKKTVTALRGATKFSYQAVREIHLIPSAFNNARFWGAYADEKTDMVRLYFPIFSPGLLEAHASDTVPALGFRALGDTTRYAMAFLLAQSPRTSVELAKAFGVSKATISHHVHLLRSAGLLQERVTGRGVVLSLDREALERISTMAAEEMFARGSAPVIQRSRHEGKSRQQRITPRKIGKQLSGADE